MPDIITEEEYRKLLAELGEIQQHHIEATRQLQEQQAFIELLRKQIEQLRIGGDTEK